MVGEPKGQEARSQGPNACRVQVRGKIRSRGPLVKKKSEF